MVLKKVFSLLALLLMTVTLAPLVAQTNSFKSFDGTEIVFDDEGNGAIVLLIHGFLGSRKSWYKTELKKELLQKGYRVIAPDLRGNGDSGKPQTDNAYRDNAEVKDLIRLLDYLKVNRCIAVGYSRGSIVLAKLLTVDKRIEKVVLGGMGIDFTNLNWERKLLFSAAFDGETTEETQGAVDYAMSIGADLRSLHLQQKHQPVTSVEELGNLSLQLLVIAGDKDLDNGNPKDLKDAIPNSILKIVEGDHNNTYKTKAFSNAILEFLSE